MGVVWFVFSSSPISNNYSFFKSPSPSSKSNRFKMRRPLDFGHSVKG